MKASSIFQASAVLLAALAFLFAAGAPAVAQENPPPHSATSPPKYLNIVHERLKPGREGAYDGQLGAIRDDYERYNIPAYWLELRSLTGPDEMAALNFFDSFAAMQTAVDGIGAGVRAHPELGPMQEKLLEGNVSSVSNLIAERVDAPGFRFGTIDFAKMRLLHMTVFNLRPGHEAEFANAAQTVASWYEKGEGASPWVTYAVKAGAPAPAYVMLRPFTSLNDEDAAPARSTPAMEIAGLAGIATSAYASVETNIYFVYPQLSHMPADFTAADPDYWTPKPLPAANTKKPNQ